MQRIPALDLARGFTVLFITPVHVFIVYGDPKVFETVVGYVLRFMAEGPGAQLFMFHLGITAALSEKSVKNHLRRALVLFGAGFILNILKFIIPALFGVLPPNLMKELVAYRNLDIHFQSFFIGDILHFAGITVLVISILKKYRYPLFFAFIFLLLVLLFSGNNASAVDFSVFNYAINIFMGEPPAVFFPIVPWLIYPLSGFIVGIAYKIAFDSIWPLILFSGLILLILGFLAICFFNMPYGSFYHTDPAGSFLHLGFVMVWIFIWFLLAKKNRNNYFFILLRKLSGQITIVYFIQWPLIIWCLPAFGYHQLSLMGSVTAAILLTYISLQLTNSVVHFKALLKDWYA